MADELERARKRESKLVAVFSAIDVRESAEAALGDALIELKDLGVAQADLAEMTGLSARDIGAAIRAAKDLADEAKSSGQTGMADGDEGTDGGEHHASAHDLGDPVDQSH